MSEGLTRVGRNQDGLGVVGLADDARVVEMWLHGKKPHTQRAYRGLAGQFVASVGLPLAQVSLGDLQDFIDGLPANLSDASRGRSIAAIKSLLSFGHGLGYLPFNVGAAVKIPKAKDTLAERILSEADVARMLALETNARNHAILLTLYGTAARVSEMCGMKWRDLQPRDKGEGQVTLYGKGSKTRQVRFPASLWQELLALRGDAGDDQFVFVSRQSDRLSPQQAWRIARGAARRAGINKNVSPHWMRHSHASHAIDRGAPISLVQGTLGHESVATTGRYLHARPAESSSKYLPI